MSKTDVYEPMNTIISDEEAEKFFQEMLLLTLPKEGQGDVEQIYPLPMDPKDA